MMRKKNTPAEMEFVQSGDLTEVYCFDTAPIPRMPYCWSYFNIIKVIWKGVDSKTPKYVTLARYA